MIDKGQKGDGGGGGNAQGHRSSRAPLHGTEALAGGGVQCDLHAGMHGYAAVHDIPTAGEAPASRNH